MLKDKQEELQLIRMMVEKEVVLVDMISFAEKHFGLELRLIAYSKCLDFESMKMIEKERTVKRLLEESETDFLNIMNKKANKLSRRIFGKDFKDLTHDEVREVIEEREYIKSTWQDVDKPL